MRRLARTEEIMQLLRAEGNASIVYLARTLNVSESSIRRDLDYMLTLPRYQRLQRVHGGVVLNEKPNEFEYMFELKVSLNSELKKAIAHKAIEYVGDADSIIIDSGTTCLFFSQLLRARKQLKVTCTDVKIAEELGKHAEIESSIMGGIVRPGFYTIGGDAALESLDRFHLGKAFMSADAIDVYRGLSNVSEFEVGVKKRIIRNAKQVILMVDCTKFNRTCLYKIADLDDRFIIITNKDLDDATSEGLRRAGLELVLV